MVVVRVDEDAETVVAAAAAAVVVVPGLPVVVVRVVDVVVVTQNCCSRAGHLMERLPLTDAVNNSISLNSFIHVYTLLTGNSFSNWSFTL